jgi:hypothetical protein
MRGQDNFSQSVESLVKSYHSVTVTEGDERNIHQGIFIDDSSIYYQ